MNARTFFSFVLIAAAVAIAPLAQAGTLDDVKARGELRCGVSGTLPGFASPDSKGEMQGFDVDFCRATAAAIGVKVRTIALTAKERFPALQSGEVDVLYRNTTWTMSRDVNLGFDFAGVNYYDGQGFMVRKSQGVKSARELDGASVCVDTGTTTELNLADYFRSNGMKYKPVVFEGADNVRAAYDAGRCDVHTTDKSGLAGQRSALKTPGDHIILPETISKEPLGPAVRHGDNAWGDVVRWVLNALIVAEEKGLTQANVAQMATSSQDPEVQRLLGTTGSFGKDLGLSADWAVKAVQSGGNYGEMFTRNLGPSTPLNLDRGLNEQWSKGGILYAPPVR
jgi:general L-amino acid transport system substrate-binding protein